MRQMLMTGAALAAAWGGAAAGQEPEGAADARDTVVVWGRAIDLLGEAKSASQGIVGYADFENRPLSRVGELVEVIPGLVATQHSGTGKANQYFLRGFNLDHGTDFSASVDGAPVNLRTHGHGQGYLDLNFIIPEVVQRVEYRKGPYYADAGDFSLAGSSNFVTLDSLERGFAQITAGDFGYARGVAADSLELGGVALLAAAEGQVYDGPWVLDEDLKKFNGLLKATRETAGFRGGLALWAYDADWTSTDQIPRRAVESGLVDRLGYIDPDLGGETTRVSLEGDAEWDHAGGRTSAAAYVTSYDLDLFSDFTYLLADPVNGDELEQRDRRWVYGGSLEHARDARLFGRGASLRVGAQARRDDIRDVGLYLTAGRERLSTVRQDRVEETSLGVFAEAEAEILPRLRATLGAREDWYEADVEALSLPGNSGSADDSLFSPSAGLAWRAGGGLELYANYGRGFHSNDARGATIRTDPATGGPADPVDLLAPGEGAELGARWEQGPVNATLSLFQLDLDSELVFVGDAGATEVSGATRRRGVEASAFVQAADWLVLDASAAYTDARSTDAPSGEDRIPGAVESVLGAGAEVNLGGLSGNIRVRHFGEAPLIEDGSVRSEPTTVVNAGVNYTLGRTRIALDVFNLFDSEDADITYFYESRLPGEPPEGVSDIHLHPIEPRQVRVSLRVAF